MKINEIITEGILSGIGKGLAAGLGIKSAADQYQRTAHLDNKAQIEKNKADAQAQAHQRAELLAAQPDKLNWHWKSQTLTVNGNDFRRLKNGRWKDMHADELVDPSAEKELNNNLNIAQGKGPLKADPVAEPVSSEPVADPVAKPVPIDPVTIPADSDAEPKKKVGAVKVGNLTITKFDNGFWYDVANDEIISNKNDIDQLNKVLALQPKPKTGGKVPGQVSQTPNAQRKRAARQPQVFSSNRRA